MPFQEVVEAEGHLIDSHVMENIFDKVVEYHGRFEVEQFRIGRTNSEPSYLRLKVETPDEVSLDRLLHELLSLGCAIDSNLRNPAQKAARGGLTYRSTGGLHVSWVEGGTETQIEIRVLPVGVLTGTVTLT